MSSRWSRAVGLYLTETVTRIRDVTLSDRRAPSSGYHTSQGLIPQDLSSGLPIHRDRVYQGRKWLTPRTRTWLGPLSSQLPNEFWIHDNPASHEFAARNVALACVRGNGIFLGASPYARSETVIRHELVHLAQIELTRRGADVAPQWLVEFEAHEMCTRRAARPVRLGADPYRSHPFVWFVAIGVGAYILMRPDVANAPGPRDRVIRGPSAGQILGEAICLFVIPGGAMSLGGRLGLGFLGKTALAGASANVGLRAVDDVSRGAASPPLLYLFDATTGAVIGFVVPGGIRLIGRAGTRAFDSLATYGLRQSDIALTRVLAEQAARGPLTAAQAQQVLQTRGMAGQVSRWWLNRRGVIVLYRGQDRMTSQILSPLARQEGVAASREMVQRLQAIGMSEAEIAGYTARWHTQAVPPFAAPPGFAHQPLGAVGIPTTRLPGIAANFGDDGVIYVIRVPRAGAISPQGWQGLQLEGEHVIFNQIPPGSIVKTLPARSVAPITVNESGLLVPGAR